MRSLSEFLTNQQVFKEATALPPFFDTNLVDPGRVVKSFLDDPQAHIHIFYYQYLRICFELDSPKSEPLVQKIEELINNQSFQFIFYQDDDPSIYNDLQAKKLISQFFGVLSAGQLTVLQAINMYPIMDVIFVHFFRTLMILTNKAQSLDNYIPRDDLLSFLCGFFGIEVEFHDECIRYVDSDIFVYDYSENAVYMAYISSYDLQNNEQGTSYLDQPSSGRQNNKQQTAYQAPSYSLTQDSAATQLNTQKQSYGAVKDSYNYGATDYGAAKESYGAKDSYGAAKDNYGAAKDSYGSKNSYNGGVKESYVASQFMDYTYQGQRLDNKGKTALKGSDSQINVTGKLDSQAKNISRTIQLQDSKFAQSYNVAPLSTVQAPKQLAYIETASISSGSENRNFTDYTVPTTNTQSNPQLDSLIKGNAATKPATYTQNIQASNSVSTFATTKPLSPPSTYQYEQPIPTKDYSSFLNQYNPPTTNSFQPTSKNSFETSKPSSYNISDSKKDIFFNPKVQPIYSPKIESNTYTSKAEAPFFSSKTDYSTKAEVKQTTNITFQTYDYKPSVQPYSAQSNLKAQTSGQSASVSVGGGKKKPFGLNVSEQFTSSLTIKSMAEPFKSSVQNIKTRARNYRTSLTNFIK